MPSQNEFVVRHTKPILVGSIMDKKEHNLGSIIASEILSRAKSLQFPSLITGLYKQVEVPRNEKTNVEVNPSTSTNIRRIEVVYLRDEDDRSRKKPTYKMLIVDVEALEYGVVELRTKACIPFSSPTVHCSAAPILST